MQTENEPVQRLAQLILNGGGYFVRCNKWWLGEKGHRFKPLNENIDINLFEDLLEGKVSIHTFYNKLLLNINLIFSIGFYSKE